MFMGEYNHTIDAKGRLIIPSKFRELLGEEFVLTKGLDGCLSIYPMDEWESFEMKPEPEIRPEMDEQVKPDVGNSPTNSKEEQ